MEKNQHTIPPDFPALALVTIFPQQTWVTAWEMLKGYPTAQRHNFWHVICEMYNKSGENPEELAQIIVTYVEPILTRCAGCGIQEPSFCGYCYEGNDEEPEFR